MKILKYINKILPIFKKKSDVNSFKNVLLVSNTGLGDTILGTPAIISLRKSFPELKISFLINKKMYKLFESFDYVDDFILYQTGFINQLILINTLRKKKIDTIFLFHSNGPEDIFFSILSGASNILKATDNVNHDFKDIFLNKITGKKQHIIENKLDLIKYFNPRYISSRMEISKEFYKKENNIYKKEKDKKYIGFQLGAQDTYKIWPIEKFISLANVLIKDKFYKIVLFGATKEEIEMAQTLMSSVSDNSVIINQCGKSKIEELPSMILNLDTLVTNDTGTMHLAVALNIPTISLFGPTDSKIYGPFQDLDIHTVIQKDGFFVNNVAKKKRTQAGINIIDVNEVLKEVKRKTLDKID